MLDAGGHEQERAGAEGLGLLAGMKPARAAGDQVQLIAGVRFLPVFARRRVQLHFQSRARAVWALARLPGGGLRDLGLGERHLQHVGRHTHGSRRASGLRGHQARALKARPTAAPIAGRTNTASAPKCAVIQGSAK